MWLILGLLTSLDVVQGKSMWPKDFLCIIIPYICTKTKRTRT